MTGEGRRACQARCCGWRVGDCGLDIMAGGANAMLKHAVTLMLERHAQVIEIPQDRAKCVEEHDTKDHVMAINRGRESS